MSRRTLKPARVLFAVGSWGLGHATRSLPVIRSLIDGGHQVTVLASGGSLQLLTAELGSQCEFLLFPGMRVPLGSTPFRFYLKYTFTLPLIWWDTWRQHELLGQLLRSRRFDAIVSDNRYAVWDRQIPSYLLAHGLRFIAPGRNPVLERGLERFNARAFRFYRRILVPDFEYRDLSGDLSHGLSFYPSGQVRYVGLLSSVERQPLAAGGLDMFISISGPEPQRTILEAAVLRQLPRLPVKGLLGLGLPGKRERRQLGGWSVAGYLDRTEQADAMNRAGMVVVRAGYSTIMELAEVGKTAVLIPTPGQTEQEYVAWRLAARGHAFAASQETVDLVSILEKGSTAKPYVPGHLTARSVQLIQDEIAG